MKQFLKITKTKITIIISFIALSFIWNWIALNYIITNNFDFVIVVPVLLLVSIILGFYFFACLATYLVEKKEKTTLSFYESKQFLKITRTKIVITISLVALSFAWQWMVESINSTNMHHIAPLPSIVFSILKPYFFTCVAVYLVDKHFERQKETEKRIETLEGQLKEKA